MFAGTVLSPRYAAGLMYESAPAADVLRASGINPEALRAFMPRVDPSQVKVRVASPWFRRLWAKGIAAVALPNGIFVQPAVMDRFRSGAEPQRSGKLIVHELMHIEQWRRYGPIRHLAQYISDYVRNRWNGSGHWEAYRAIRIEQEARDVAAAVIAGGPR
jgi:hypothetical protein